LVGFRFRSGRDVRMGFYNIISFNIFVWFYYPLCPEINSGHLPNLTPNESICHRQIIPLLPERVAKWGRKYTIVGN
jgi:hypothetical protein